MPELPEVQTTVTGLDTHIRGLTISDTWSGYKNKNHITGVIGKKVTRVSCRGKNILIHLSDTSIILIHMKMTGHIMCGDYNKKDPFNRFIYFSIMFTNGEQMDLCDMRKFAKVKIAAPDELAHLGPEPLEKEFTFSIFKNCLYKKPKSKIKPTLLDQTILVGVGNIYSDEALWRAGIHPEQVVQTIPDKKLRLLYTSIQTVLKKGIDFGGDSMSDYRNIHGEPGAFQGQHQAYRKTGTTCLKKGCGGTILRKIVGGRSAHFCSVHQRLV